MLTAAVLGLAVTVGIPLMTKAVIDGPVRHRDQNGLWLLGTAAVALGACEALLWMIRRWLGRLVPLGVVEELPCGAGERGPGDRAVR